MDSLIVFKICDSTRMRRVTTPAFGNISSLLEQGSIALDKRVARVLTEDDGCQITTDLVLTVFKDSVLMMLEPHESWTPVYLHNSYKKSNAKKDKDTNMLNIDSVLENQTLLFNQSNDEISNSHVSPVMQRPPNIPEELSDASQQSVTTCSHDIAMDMITSSALVKVNLASDQRDLVSSVLLDSDIMVVQMRDDGEDLFPENENMSPNTSQRRNLSTITQNINIIRSSKRYATTDMKFRAFDINWQKVSDNVLARLKNLQDFRDNNTTLPVPAGIKFAKSDLSALANSIVDQLRVIDVHITAKTMEEVAKQVLSKYPCLNFVDDDGFGSGQSHVALKHKMINRNTYLNRYKDSDSRSSAAETKRIRNAKAGTIKEYWEVSTAHCSKDIISKLARDEPGILTMEFLTASQGYVRNCIDQPKSLKDILVSLPILRRRQIIGFHFEKATGVQIDLLEKIFSAKRAKIIDFSGSCRPALGMKINVTDYDIFNFLCSFLGENINHLIIQKEIGTKVSEITTECVGPVQVDIDLGNDNHVFYVMAEQVRLTEGTRNVVTAIADLLGVHFVYNFMYMKLTSKILEFVQEYFYKILPISGSKSRATRKSKQQRMVQRLIEAISSHTMPATFVQNSD